MKPDPEKIRAVEQYPVNMTKKEVRGFLGFTGYYRRFIADYATLVLNSSDTA